MAELDLQPVESSLDLQPVESGLDLQPAAESHSGLDLRPVDYMPSSLVTPEEERTGNIKTEPKPQIASAVGRGINRALESVIPTSIGGVGRMAGEMAAGLVSPITMEDVNTAQNVAKVVQGAPIEETFQEKPFNQYNLEDWVSFGGTVGLQGLMAVPLFRGLHTSAKAQIIDRVAEPETPLPVAREPVPENLQPRVETAPPAAEAANVLEPWRPGVTIASPGELAQRVAESPVAVEFSTKVDPVYKYTTFEAKTPGGLALGDINGNTLRIRNTGVDVKNQGMGTALYQKIVEEADARGLTVTSDKSVSPDAVNLYNSLERKGYTVEKNPEAVQESDGTLTTAQGKGPVFTIRPPKPLQPEPAAATPEKVIDVQGNTVAPEVGNVVIPTNGEMVDLKPPEVASITQKPSKIGQSIEAKAVEAKLTGGFEGTAGYDPITIKDQANRAASLVKTFPTRARAIIRGEAPLPEGLRGTPIITAMEEHLLKNPDPQIAYELANSPLTSATSVAAQEMRLMAERVPDSLASKFEEIKRARMEGAKLRGETPKTVAREITKEVVRNGSKRPTWEAFVNEIAC